MLFWRLISSIEESTCSLVTLSFSSVACCRISSSSMRRSSTSRRSAAARAARFDASGSRATSASSGAAFSSISLPRMMLSPTTAAIFSTTRACAAPDAITSVSPRATAPARPADRAATEVIRVVLGFTAWSWRPPSAAGGGMLPGAIGRAPGGGIAPGIDMPGGIPPGCIAPGGIPAIGPAAPSPPPFMPVSISTLLSLSS